MKNPAPSAAHSACRVGAHIFFLFIPGVLLAYGSRHPELPAAARARKFGEPAVCGENDGSLRADASQIS